MSSSSVVSWFNKNIGKLWIETIIYLVAGNIKLDHCTNVGIQQSQPVVVALPPYALQAFCKEPLDTFYLKHQKFEMREPNSWAIF